MKTIVIWDNCGQSPITFFVVEGDYRHLDGVYINSDDATNEQLDALNALIYQPNESGDYVHDALDRFPTDQFQPGDVVIVAGFLP